MSAATAQEPSMEDILASIRKIISEDSNSEEQGAVENSLETSPSSEEALSAVVDPAVAVSEATPPQSAAASNDPETGDVEPGEPSVLVERREFLGEAFVSGAPPAPPATAPETKADNDEEAPMPDAAPLHPAIANAKAYVGASAALTRPHNESAQSTIAQVEKPVFAGPDGAQDSTADTSINPGVEQLISPDSIERRAEEERRNHPLRRDNDREDDSFKNALMSPKTDDAVLSAFEQLKNTATDNLDGKVEALLRPMLREWLDNNLPSMVERLVREEIERVSRGD